MDDILSEMTDAMITEEMIQTVEEKVKKTFAKQNIIYSQTSLKAFLEGLELMLLACKSDPNDHVMPMTMMLIVKKMVKDINAKVEKATSQVAKES